MAVARVNPAFSFLKYLDQPLLLEKFNRVVPVLLPLTGAVAVAGSVLKAPADDRKKTFVKNASVMGTTIASALLAARLFTGLEPHNAIAAAKAVCQRLAEEKVPVSEALSKLLEKSKTKILNPAEVHALRRELCHAGAFGDELVSKVIPDPAAVGAKAILGDIWNLSMMGLFPVLGGVVGGLLGNVLNHDDWKAKFKDQVKEGFYQYTSNIVLCNIGAALFLLALEKTPLAKNRMVRMGGMIAGIGFFGVWGGSTIANFFGKHLVNPICDHGVGYCWEQLKETVHQDGVKGLFQNLNDERHPELVDIGIHIDDLATVGVLAGLKWIMPALSFLYTFSGYRAGIGYRNGEAAKNPAPAFTGTAMPPQASFVPSANSVFRTFYDQRQAVSGRLA